MAGCSGSGEKRQQSSDQMEMEMDKAESDHSAHQQMAMASGDATDQSIYNVSSTWKDRHGQDLKLNSLQGEVQIVAMLYTNCEFACPRILADMQRIRDSLSDKVLQETNFVIVSIDPERDTPERLTQFADENNLSDKQWTLLNGDRGDILELAALLGFKYKRISDTDFTHSNMLTVLNRQGEIAFQRNRLGDNPSDIIAAIEKAAS
jgi:protein SCO1/2